MHISQITMTDYQSRGKQSFKARMPKNLMKQMAGKTEPLKDLTYTTAKGIAYTLSAATVAGLYAKHDTEKAIDNELEGTDFKVQSLPNIDSLNKLGDKEFARVAGFQDVDGDTIFHKEGVDTLELIYKLDKNDPRANAKIFSIKNIDNKTAYQANPVPHVRDIINDIATNSNLRLDQATDLLEANANGDDFTNLHTFLTARRSKPGATTEMTKYLLSRVIRSEDGLVTVTTKDDVIYPDLPLEVASKMFVPANLDEEKIDTKYLKEWAKPEEIGALVDSALKSNFDTAIDRVMENANDDFKDKVVENIDLNIQNSKNLDRLTNFLEQDDCIKLFERQDDDKCNIMHYAAASGKANLFGEMLDIMLDTTSLPDTEKVLLQKNCEEHIPSALNDYAALATIDYYSNNSVSEGRDWLESLATIFSAKNGGIQNTVLHGVGDLVVVERFFDVMKDEPELLSNVLQVQNNNGDTAYQRLSELYPDEETEFIKNKIIELATDSDLPMDESIRLLAVNGVEPQIAEYMAMQLEAEDKLAKEEWGVLR